LPIVGGRVLPLAADQRAPKLKDWNDDLIEAMQPFHASKFKESASLKLKEDQSLQDCQISPEGIPLNWAR
jgi:hypothetical protein